MPIDEIFRNFACNTFYLSVSGSRVAAVAKSTIFEFDALCSNLVLPGYLTYLTIIKVAIFKSNWRFFVAFCPLN